MIPLNISLNFIKVCFLTGKKIFYVSSCIYSCILYQILWLNRSIQINRKPVFYNKFSLNIANFLMQLVDRDRVFNYCNIPEEEYDL